MYADTKQTHTYPHTPHGRTHPLCFVYAQSPPPTEGAMDVVVGSRRGRRAGGRKEGERGGENERDRGRECVQAGGRQVREGGEEGR